ncbi:efflux transporter periplasmic adaptor subunit [Bacterioplanes sanyensis]|uniref:Efflux transporter periplasmic adaptor subunit n=2 Tax=Bacterioplanes sanyensis TaxID=1249553 RepID=A0A222FNA4_9GAMM|nr:efflux transporter periplasmic adaptor subunit [Bacterioplanes sanyensis]
MFGVGEFCVCRHGGCASAGHTSADHQSNQPINRGKGMQFPLLRTFSLAVALASGAVVAAERPPMPVEAQVVNATTVTRAIEMVGSLSADESVTISAEVAGRISKINFQEGQSVKAGDLLFTLDSSIERAQLAQAQASKRLNELEYRRASELLKKNVGSATDRDAALAKLKIDEAEVELARERVAKMTLTAPFDGTLGLRQVSVGKYVSPGEALVPLVATNPIKLEFRVPEVYVRDLSEGLSVNARVDALPGETFSGEIYAISPEVDVNGRSFKVLASIANDDGRLKPGLFARVELTLANIDSALMVKEEALVPQGRAQLIYKLVDGKVQINPVTVGLRKQGEVQILDGVAAGDVVVTAGQMKLQPGAAAAAINLPQPQ